MSKKQKTLAQVCQGLCEDGRDFNSFLDDCASDEVPQANADGSTTHTFLDGSKGDVSADGMTFLAQLLDEEGGSSNGDNDEDLESMDDDNSLGALEDEIERQDAGDQIEQRVDA